MADLKPVTNESGYEYVILEKGSLSRIENDMSIKPLGKRYARTCKCKRTKHGTCSVCNHEMPSWFNFCANCGSEAVS